jgi:hypothetical protein
MKIMIGFSGGMDSTYVLWKTLMQTQDEVTAVFIRTQNISRKTYDRYDMRTFSGLQEEENVAATIANWLNNNIRTFSFTPVDFSEQYVVRGFGHPNSPQTYLARYAASQMSNGNCDKLLLCSEKENDGWANAGTVQTRRTGAEAALDAFTQTATRGSIEWPLIQSNYTQAYALSELPSELQSLLSPCSEDNDSYKCRKRRWFQNLLNEGKTPEETWNIYYNNCMSYQDKWFSMKYWLNGDTPTDQNTWIPVNWPTNYTVPT